MMSHASEQARIENRRLEVCDRFQRDLTHWWAAVAEHNAEYRTLGQAEALRMGADQPSRIQSPGWRVRKTGLRGGEFASQVSGMESTHVRSARPALVPP